MNVGTMMWLQCCMLSVLLLPLTHSYLLNSRIYRATRSRQQQPCFLGLGDETSRRQFGIQSLTVILPSIFSAAAPAKADVSDGNALPKGAQQFARVVKLKTDLKDVTNRLTTATEGDIDKKEWDNISKFLRTIYSTAENDMKAIAKGVFDPTNQKQALNDAEEVKKYSQAGDVSASKQDAVRLASILTKISELVNDFFDALSDVPDEL